MQGTTNDFGKNKQGVDAATLRLRERNRILSQKFKLIDNTEDFEEVSSVKQEIALFQELDVDSEPKKTGAIEVLKNLMLGFFGGKTADDIEIEAEINDPNALTAKYQSKASIKQAMLIQALKSRQQDLHDLPEHKGKAKKASPLSSTLLASELIAEKALRASQEQKSQDGKSDKLLGAEAGLAAKALNGAAGALKNGGSEALLAKTEMAAAMKQAMAPMANAGLGSVVGAAIAAAAMQAHANMASHANIPSSGHGAAHGAHTAHANNAHAHSAAEAAKNANAAAKEGNKHTEKTAEKTTESAKKDDATIKHEKHDKNGIDKNREGFNAYRQEEAASQRSSQPDNKVDNKAADVVKQATPVVKAADTQVPVTPNGQGQNGVHKGSGVPADNGIGDSGRSIRAQPPLPAPPELEVGRGAGGINNSTTLHKEPIKEGERFAEIKAFNNPLPPPREIAPPEPKKEVEQQQPVLTNQRLTAAVDSLGGNSASLDNGRMATEVGSGQSAMKSRGV